MIERLSQNHSLEAAAKRPKKLRRWRISVLGVVQGVGFRPFVHRLAERRGITGFVRNTSHGVVVEAEGEPPVLDAFCRLLREQLPPLAEVIRLDVTEIPALGERSFAIRESSEEADAFSLVPPDIATCDSCIRDSADPHQRRYGYPFTNCTDCGPRYSIIRSVPYDRPTTTMAAFEMCVACRAEYDDPDDRRFHAQPNACASCGPSLALLSASDLAKGAVPGFEPGKVSRAVLDRVRSLLREGNIVAVKGLGGFLLACDAQNDAVVRLLRERKRRTGKPLALMAPTLAAVENLCVLSVADREAF